MLKHTFSEYEIAIKKQRFIVLDRDGMTARKLTDVEDGILLHLYKGLLSSEALKPDDLNIISQQKSV